MELKESTPSRNKRFESFSNAFSVGLSETNSPTKAFFSFEKDDKNDKTELLSDYISLFVQVLVDEVCIFDSKGLERGFGAGRKVVPVVFEGFTEVLHHENSVLNEKGDDKGKFGWCFICRNKADFYCKDLRLPICSILCKKKLGEMDGN